MSIESVVKIGVVGSGSWWPDVVRNLRRSRGCQVKTICDMGERRDGQVQRLNTDVATTSRFEDLLDDRGIDAIVVAPQTRHHFDMGRACLNAGKHTYIEQPTASTVAEGEELVDLAERQGLVLMVGHTFLFAPAVHRMKEIIDAGDVGEVRYVSARRLGLGVFQKDINVACDLAPRDISVILYLLEESPVSVACLGSSHVTRGIEDVSMMCLHFRKNRCAFVQNSWLDPKQVQEMTVVGSRRMLVYDELEPLEKLKVYDARVEAPPHYDSFAEAAYSYHYGDAYVPYIKQEEPLKLACQHFLDCIREGREPVTRGRLGLDVVRILQASGVSLRRHGAAVPLSGLGSRQNGSSPAGDGVGNGGNGLGNGNGNGGNGLGNGNGGGAGQSLRRGIPAV